MKCPKLISGKIKICDTDMFDGMVPNLSELNKFCEGGDYHLCPFFIGSKSWLDKESIAHSISDWNVFHRGLVGA